MFGGFLWNKNCLQSPKSAHFCIEKNKSDYCIFLSGKLGEREETGRPRLQPQVIIGTAGVPVPGHQLCQ